MTIKELLRDKLAPAISRVILKHAFGVDAATIAGPLLDWLSGQFKNREEARQAERFAQTIANRVVDGLVPVFERDHSPDLNAEAVALTLGETLDQHFDGKFLVAHDLDPERITRAAFQLRPPGDLRRASYSTSDIALYERALPALIQALVPRAKEFADFDVANAAEVLKRLSEVAREARHTRAGVDHLVRTQQVWERRRAEAWRAFEQAYADAVLDRWNELELFGIDVSADLQRTQKLSVAYIHLNLQSAEVGEPDERSGHLASFEELLVRSADSGQPLLILGEAGGGKTTLLRWAACEAVLRQRADDAPDPFPSARRERPYMGSDRIREPEKEPKLAWWARVPFLLRLREVKDGIVPKEPAWPGRSAALPRDPPPDWLEEILGGGHGLILLDGLDELGSTGRDVVRATLRSILRDRRGNLVLVTSRPGAFEEDWFEGVPLQVTTIRAMSPAQRQACITSWHEAVAQANPKDQEATPPAREGSDREDPDQPVSPGADHQSLDLRRDLRAAPWPQGIPAKRSGRSARCAVQDADP